MFRRFALAAVVALLSLGAHAQTVLNTQVRSVNSIAEMQGLDPTRYSTTRPILLVAGSSSGMFIYDDSNLSSILVKQSDTSTAVDDVTEIITVANHDLFTGDAVTPTTSVNGLVAGDFYYVIRLTKDTFQLGNSPGGAAAETARNLTGTTNFTMNNIIDPLQAVYVIQTGDSLTGSNGAWVRQGRTHGNSVAWWGAVADGTTNDANAIFRAIKFTEWRGGTVSLLCGKSSINFPMLINRDAVTIEGCGGTDIEDGGSELEGTHTNGPVLRIMGRHWTLRDFTVTASAARIAATRITKDNYAGLGLSRNQQNYGIWVEAHDVSHLDVDEGHLADVDDGYAENVWVNNQPNDGWVFISRHYGTVLMKCGASLNDGHGLYVGAGVYTGRSTGNITSAGVLTAILFQSYTNQGYGIASGHPDELPGRVVRFDLISPDVYNNGIATSRMFTGVTDYPVYMVADNSYIEGGAVAALGVQGAIYTAGRHLRQTGLRYLLIEATKAAVWAQGILGGRQSAGLVVEDPLVSVATTDIAFVVNNSTGFIGLRVSDYVEDGTYDDLVGPDLVRTLTISGGNITVDGDAHYFVDTEGSAASDNVDNILGGQEGDVVSFQSVSSARDPSFRPNNLGAGNIYTGPSPTPTAKALTSTPDIIVFQKRGLQWHMLLFQDNL